MAGGGDSVPLYFVNVSYEVICKFHRLSFNSKVLEHSCSGDLRGVNTFRSLLR